MRFILCIALALLFTLAAIPAESVITGPLRRGEPATGTTTSRVAPANLTEVGTIHFGSDFSQSATYTYSQGDMYYTVLSNNTLAAVNVTKGHVVWTKQFLNPQVGFVFQFVASQRSGHVVVNLQAQYQLIGLDPETGHEVFKVNLLNNVDFTRKETYRILGEDLYLLSGRGVLRLDMVSGNTTTLRGIHPSSDLSFVDGNTNDDDRGGGERNDGARPQVLSVHPVFTPDGYHSHFIIYDLRSQDVLINISHVSKGGRYHGSDSKYFYFTNITTAPNGDRTSSLRLFHTQSGALAFSLPYYQNVGGFTKSTPALTVVYPTGVQLLSVIHGGGASVVLDVLNLTAVGTPIIKQVQLYNADVLTPHQVGTAPGKIVVWFQNFSVFSYPGGEKLEVPADLHEAPFYSLGGGSGLVLREAEFGTKVTARSTITGDKVFDHTFSHAFQLHARALPEIRRWVTAIDPSTLAVFKY